MRVKPAPKLGRYERHKNATLRLNALFRSGFIQNFQRIFCHCALRADFGSFG